jgi:hypothetical protein
MSAVTKTYDIMPDTSVFEKLGATGEPAYKAVAELIDNSVDAREPGRPLIIELSFTTSARGRLKTIVIEDDAAGMSEEGLVRAMTIGLSNKGSQQKIGRFGMGLKTALASLGRAWTITTATNDDRVASQITEDLDKFVANQSWQVSVSKVPKSTVGTRIELSRCDHITAAHFERDLTNNLGELFKHFLDAGELQLYVDGNPLVVPDVVLIEGSKVEIDTTIKGKRVHGWVGLRTFGGNNYGFSLIRYNRVIMRNEKIGFNVHQQYNRIVGELHLDEFEVNHHKTGFVQTTEAWEEFKTHISEAIRPVVQQAHELSTKDHRKVHRDVQKMIESSLLKLFSSVLADDELKMLATGKQRTKDGIEDETTKVKRERQQRDPQDHPDVRDPYEPKPRRVSPMDGLKCRVDWVNDGEEAPRMRWTFEEGELVVYVNLDHPAHPKAQGQHVWAIQMTIEALASCIASDRARQDQLEEPSLSLYETVLDRVYRHAIKTGLLL